ncbi:MULTISPECIES: thioesterase family protein [unclassified Streptomyces]|uniref:thioesterase family protein n=1 Tax=unclassified Streptomyces TaxID=2593676 RepID=UPI001DC4B960|nr:MULTISPECIES: thioesterase family protein [unclassified Streptomyces]MBD0707574.1 thioesterase [Streptomyces sp. CBMA291]MBD0717994.1 thioesterase [Streptomyces sp. CBMA370]
MTTGALAPASYYERTGEHRFKPTAHAGGAWSADEQHFSPLAGLVAHALEQHLAARPEAAHGPLALSRISYDILGRIALDECEISVATVRPGRTIELLEATVTIDGRPVVRARAWLLASLDTSAVADSPVAPLPAPGELAPWPMGDAWEGGYVSSIEVRRTPPVRKGRTTAWLSSPVALVAGEEIGPLASYIALVDTANGIAVQQDPATWMFPNLDLTIHLHRQPRGRWTGLDTTVTFGPSGQGLTSSVLHDVDGPVGRAEQILTVRPQPGG